MRMGKSGAAGKKGRNYGSKLLRALMGVLVVSLLVMLILSMVLYANYMRREIALARTSLMGQTARQFEAEIKAIEQNALEKGIDPTLSSEVSASMVSGMRGIEPIVSLLREYKNESRTIASAALYLHDAGYVVTSDDGLWTAADYYDQAGLALCRGVKKTEWSEMRGLTDNTGVERQVLTFATRVPNDGRMGESYFIVNLSANKLAAALQPWAPASGEDTFLLDREGHVLCSGSGRWLHEAIDPAGNRYALTTTVATQYNGWTFVNTVPISYIMRPLFEMALATLLVTAVFLVLGTLLVRRLSAGIYRPIAEIIGELRQHANQPGRLEDSDAEYLRVSVLQVLEQNEALRQDAESIEEERRGDLLRRWLAGRLPGGRQDIEAALGRLGLPAGLFYCTVLCAIDHASIADSPFAPTEGDLLLFAVENVATELLAPNMPLACTWMENDQLVLLVSFGDYAQLLDRLASIRDAVSRSLHITITAAVSQPTSDPMEILPGWERCQELMSHRLELGSGVITGQSVPRGAAEQSHMLISQQLRDQLTANTVNGNIAGFAAAVDKLVAEAKSRPLASPETAYAAFMSILSILIAALNDKGWKPGEVFGPDSHPYQAVSAMETLDEMAAYVKRLQAASAEYLGEQKETKNKKLMGLVTGYIQANYHKDLRLGTVAEHVFLSPSYLSRLFRQEVGQTFLEYITDVRIEKSKELLRRPELRLAEIAEQTQFGTANNFIKVFKKHEGITPGQYRGRLAENTLGTGGKGEVFCEQEG